MRIFRNNVYAMITHVGIVALFHFLYTDGHLVSGSIGVLIMLAIVGYFSIGRLELHTERSVLKDLLSVVSVAVLGVVISVLIALKWLRIPIQLFTPNGFFLYFNDLFVTVWLNSLISESAHKKLLFVIILLVASATPTLMMWLGLLSKRKRWNA